MNKIMRWSFLTAMTAILAACGGSGGSSTASSSSQSSQSSAISASSASSVASSSLSQASSSSSEPSAHVGVFVDSAVAGIGYRTSPGGREGLTSAEGEYLFDEGDEVVFFIGELELPPVRAKGVVTPFDIANTDDDTNQIVINIARLLQSLDADGDPSNGITIPSTAAAAAVAVSFDQSVEDFAASEAVTNLVLNSGSSNTTLVSAEAAVAHLQGSVDAQKQSLIGSWYYQDITDPDVDRQIHIVLTFLDSERFVLINDEDATEDHGGLDGFEYGTYVWNLRTGVADFNWIVDTNGNWGTSHPCHEDEVIVLEPRGDILYLHVEGGVGETCDEVVEGEITRLAFHRVHSEENPLVGSWVIDELDSEDPVLAVAVFTADGYYFQMQDSESNGTGFPGIERGTYSHDPVTNVVLFVTQTDTNGQWGSSHSCAVRGVVGTNNLACGEDGQDVEERLIVEGDTLTFISEADTIVNGGEEDPVVFFRVGSQ